MQSAVQSIFLIIITDTVFSMIFKFKGYLASTTKSNNPIIEIHNLRNILGGRLVHNDLNLIINQGEIVAIIGSSGCGKTTLLRSILMLQKPISGVVSVHSFFMV